MDKDKFVVELKKIAPKREDFIKYNVPDDFIDKMINRYNCKPKTKSKEYLFTDDTILNLLQEYDCTNVEIAIITFDKKPYEEPDYYKIGNAELDVLVLNRITKEIEVRDHDSLSHTIWKCASNSGNFLEALMHCATYLISRLKDSSLDDEEDQGLILRQVEISTAKAGGDEYINFYKMLLGYFGE